MTGYLNLALLDTMADWEVGYLTAYTSRTELQRRPDAVRLRTVGLTRDPVRTVVRRVINLLAAGGHTRAFRSAQAACASQSSGSSRACPARDDDVAGNG